MLDKTSVTISCYGEKPKHQKANIWFGLSTIFFFWYIYTKRNKGETLSFNCTWMHFVLLLLSFLPFQFFRLKSQTFFTFILPFLSYLYCFFCARDNSWRASLPLQPFLLGLVVFMIFVAAFLYESPIFQFFVYDYSINFKYPYKFSIFLPKFVSYTD